MAKLNELTGLNVQGDDAEEAKCYLEALSLILNEKQFEFANDTLQGIYDYVEEKLFVSEGQKKAVANILRSKGKELEDYF